ncbi:type VII secretion protein EccB [Streptomyces sp. NPDC000410]|uniref:type VII secretion protein EccB n=1 Tax=Streptomyces sp. NPDC000410 TaxID=3154254 RepID=UPI00331F8905
MQTRRDQVQAHLFTLSRVQSGLLRGEPDAPETPMRRFSLGTMAGALVGVVVMAGFAAFGFISPGSSKAFQKEGTLVIVKDKGARYLYLGGALHPVANYSSALLITGQRTLKPQNVTAKAIKNVPRGPAVGIVGAPEGLPDAKSMDRGPWAICSTEVDDGNGGRRPVVTAYAGGRPEGLRVLRDTEAIGVEGTDGKAYVAYTDRRFEATSRNALTALGFANVSSFRVGDAWINALSAGPDLEQDDVPGRGTAGVTVGGVATRVGQVLQDDANGNFFLVWKDGITPMTRTEATLVLGDPRTAAAYPDGNPVALRVNSAAIAQTAITDRQLNQGGLPPVPPTPVADPGTGTTTPCVQVEPAKNPAAPSTVRVAVRTGQPNAVSPAGIGLPAGPPAGQAPSGTTLADRVVVPAGRGVLAQEQGSAGDLSPTLFLITDSGVKYPLATPQVAQTLGYNTAAAVPVPSSVLALVPSGPVLDPEAAKRPLAFAPGSVPQAPAEPAPAPSSTPDPTGAPSRARD